MLPDQVAHSVWIMLALVLVASGVIARRLPKGKTTALAASWLGIIVALWALVAGVQTLL